LVEGQNDVLKLMLKAGLTEIYQSLACWLTNFKFTEPHTIIFKPILTLNRQMVNN